MSLSLADKKKIRRLHKLYFINDFNYKHKMNIFSDEIEQQAIERIKKFSKIANAMGFEICLGFSGGKDSQVVYDLCLRSGV